MVLTKLSIAIRVVVSEFVVITGTVNSYENHGLDHCHVFHCGMMPFDGV
jgi:hypothetical protein